MVALMKLETFGLIEKNWIQSDKAIAHIESMQIHVLQTGFAEGR